MPVESQSIPGLNDKREIRISDNDMFGDGPVDVDVGLDSGLDNFLGSDAVHFLRVIDRAIVHAQENEVFMHQNIPMLNKKVSNTIQTGSVITLHLHEYFVKVQDFSQCKKIYPSLEYFRGLKKIEFSKPDRVLKTRLKY